jgi:hypothetical protein
MPACSGDLFVLATDGETVIGYAHLRVVHDLLESARRADAPTQPQ